MDILIIILYFLQPSGEVYTDQEKQIVIEQMYRVCEYWQKQCMLETHTQVIDYDIFNEPLQLITTAQHTEDIIVYAVDNSKNRKLFFNDYTGYAQDYYRFVVVQNTHYAETTIAHELGHVLYGLPDWYQQQACSIPDIMCALPLSHQAYNQGRRGCYTQAFLGSPCDSIYLPMIYRIDNEQIKTYVSQHMYFNPFDKEFTGAVTGVISLVIQATQQFMCIAKLSIDEKVYRVEKGKIDCEGENISSNKTGS
jgi:hypothetical protein